MGEEHQEHAFTQEFWDQKYAASQRVWSGRPNQRLVDLVADLPPGVALDVGCGEGADVVWLAERGWRVTGVDVSTVALDRAGRHAAAAGVGDRTTFVHLDLLGGEELPGDNDLVTAMFVHVPDADLDRVYGAIAAAVRPGGTLLVTGHHPAERDSGLRNPHLGHLLFGPERITGLLGPQWRVLVAAGLTRPQEKDGQQVTATDTVVLARREPA